MAKSKTVSTYNWLKVAKGGLITSTVASPVLPATIITLINWQEWFSKTSTLPFGFASLLVTVIVAVIGVLKSDTVLKKADIALYFLAGLFMCIGVTCMFLSSLLAEMGYMWLYTGAGLLASGVSYTVEKNVVEKNLDFYKGLIEENCLSKSAIKKQEKIERAKEEAQKEALAIKERSRRATTD